jgi:hypothetical protein
MGNRAPPRHLAATPTLTTTGKLAYASARSRSQCAQITRFSATTDGGVSALIAEQIGGSRMLAIVGGRNAA